MDMIVAILLIPIIAFIMGILMFGAAYYLNKVGHKILALIAFGAGLNMLYIAGKFSGILYGG